MATCELWVGGTIEYQGQTLQQDFAVVSPWTASTPFPPISIGQYFPNNGRPFNHYNDGLGGIFGGRGWNSKPAYYLKNCQIDPNQTHDCVNGGCIPSTTYNTPGKYANLADCQSGCAKDSTCNGECVSAADLANLQQAAGLVQSRLCGS
jgi:hypothetical protein